ncbi:unnamed protein product [Symbiodinium pilosum]|uniref:Uncharacterized protein n=1 Tax=Symbiodinium pilosum TaxID=2952 RepID=A0A812RC64_SYMPI|nr:unnamed protein product [Symbiodinium pilosum]
MSLLAELVEEGEDAEGLAYLGEQALAELAAQNEQLEVDCRGLEAHCRDLERAGWPVPCKLEDVILASETVEEVPAEPEANLSEHVSLVVAAEAAAKSALDAKTSAEEAAIQVGKALGNTAETMESERLHELASPVISRAVATLFQSVQGDAVSPAKAAANAAMAAGLSADVAASTGFVAAGLVAGKQALQGGSDLNRSAEAGCKMTMDLAQAAGLSAEEATFLAARTASEIASEASRSAGKTCERVVEDAADAAKRLAKPGSSSLSARLGVQAAGRAAANTVAMQAPALDAAQIAKNVSSAVAAITREAIPDVEDRHEVVAEVNRAAGRVVEEAMAAVIMKASEGKATPQAPASPQQETTDQDARVKELLKAREKSFAAMADMQERCASQQSEMERLVRERAGDQEELLKLRQQLRGLEQQLPDPYHEQLQEADQMDSLSVTTGDDTSSLAESLAGSARRMRKKRNARAGQAFRQAKCLDEGVDISAVEGDVDPEEQLIRVLVSKSHASPLWRDLLIFILEKAGHATASDVEIKKELQLMAYQVKEKLSSLEGTAPSREGMLETMLKTVGKVTDQAVDSAVLYVTQDSPKHSTDAEEVVKQAFAPEARDPAQAGADAFKQNARLRLAARRNRQRGSVLSVAASISSKPGS